MLVFSRDVVQDPCLPTNLLKSVVPNSGEVKEQQKPLYSRKGIGNFEQCENNLKTLLNLNTKCIDDPCSFNGVYQPPINYSSLDLFGFSEFWYSTDDILQVSGPYNYTKFQEAASVSDAHETRQWEGGEG